MGRLLAELVGSGGVSAATAVVAASEGRVVEVAAGWRNEPAAIPARVDTLFDLASLTKPVVATLAVVLARRGQLPLDLTLGELFPRVHPRLAGRTLAALLRHRAGLLPWTPLYARARSRVEARELLLGGDLLEPGGDRLRPVYSDLGYVLWGFAAEAALGKPLSALLARHVLDPLRLSSLGPAPGAGDDVAVCALSNAREVQLAGAQGIELPLLAGPFHGVPQDGNARFLGGVAGHAGLFGCAGDVCRLAREWLAPGHLLSRRDVDEALRGSGRYLLGWWRRRVRGSAGPALSTLAYGMVGFTGGSCWIDSERDLVAVLLAHRRDAAVDLAPWRRRFHQLAVALAAGAPPGAAAG